MYFLNCIHRFLGPFHLILPLVLIGLLLSSFETQYAAPRKKKLIIVSIDGMPGYYFKNNHPAMTHMPNLKKLFKRSHFSANVISSNPTVTFPSHTSMITGVDPSAHGILNNRPHDIFERNMNGWNWYDEDIRVKTLWDYARISGKKTGNIYWPVSVGADIHYNLPQFFRAKNLEDRKILRALSGKKIYDEIRNYTGVYIHEHNTDAERMAAGIALFKMKKPDLLFIYLADVDSTHHGRGVETEKAYGAIARADKAVGLLIKHTKLYERNDLALIIISDHGFLKQKSVCYPNRILSQMGLLDEKGMRYKFSFRTSMGMAALETDDREKEEFPLEEFSAKVIEQCPGTKPLTEGEVFNKLSRQWLPKAKLFLVSDNTMGYASSPFPGPIYNPDYSSSAHGFINTTPDLHTIGSFYPPSGTVKTFRTVKDVFPNACSWLKLKCRAGEKRKGRKRP